MRILLVEDDRMFAQLIKRMLTEDGYAVDVVHTAADGRMAALVNEFDGIILDINLPGGNGIEIARELRRRGHDTPVLMLTGRTEVGDRVLGLDAGADDYVTKPFELEELRARVRALLRRGGARRMEQLAFEGVTLDRTRHRAVVAGHELLLTPREFRLLEYFMLHPGEVVTRTELLDKVWDMHFDPGSNVVDAHVARLRAKLRGQSATMTIRAVRGVGYVLERDEPHASAG